MQAIHTDSNRPLQKRGEGMNTKLVVISIH